MYNIHQQRQRDLKQKEEQNRGRRSNSLPTAPSRVNSFKSMSSTLPIHEHMSRYYKGNQTSEKLYATMIEHTNHTATVVNQCEYGEEDNAILLLLEELERNKKRKKTSYIPAQPISYTRKNRKSTTKKYDTQVESIPPPPTPMLNNYSSIGELDDIQSTHIRFNDRTTMIQSRQLSRSTSAPSSRASTSRLSHNYLSTVIPKNTQQNFIETKRSVSSVRNHQDDGTSELHTTNNQEDMIQKEEQMNVLLGDLVHDYQYNMVESKEPKNQRMKQRYQQYLQNQYHKHYPLIKAPFKRHFGSKDFGWTDPKVHELNKKIEESCVEQAVFERVIQDNIEFIEKKLKVNQIRKQFTEQRENNFLKRVVKGDPRVHMQLQDLVSNDDCVSDEAYSNAPSEADDDYHNERMTSTQPVAVLFDSTKTTQLRYKGLIPYSTREASKSTLESARTRSSRGMSPRPKSANSTFLRRTKLDPSRSELSTVNLSPELELKEIDLFEQRIKTMS